MIYIHVYVPLKILAYMVRINNCTELKICIMKWQSFVQYIFFQYVLNLFPCSKNTGQRRAWKVVLFKKYVLQNYKSSRHMLVEAILNAHGCTICTFAYFRIFNFNKFWVLHQFIKWDILSWLWVMLHYVLQTHSLLLTGWC